MTSRHLLQVGFLALTLIAVFVLASNAERWCPFGGVEALYTYLSEGNMTCSLAVSNFFVLGGLLLSVLLLRRAFCSYICPIGAISEWTGDLGKRLGAKPWRTPRMLDSALSLLKYGVLALILWVTWRAGELHFRAADPCYALLSRHGEDITFWAYVVAGAILVGSLLTALPFCRWLCPLAAVINPLSRFGFMRVRRDREGCLECGKCGKVCPMHIPVPARLEVREARCTACLSCVAACPTKGGSALAWSPPGTRTRVFSRRAVAAALLGLTATTVGASYLFPLPSFVKVREGIEPPAQTATLELGILGVNCRGSCNLLYFFLDRDDPLTELEGYLKLEAWPEPGAYSRIRITYDPDRVDPELIKDAIATPYYDDFQGFERESPFEIEGYAPWALVP